MWSYLRIPAFRLRSWEVHLRWWWYTSLSFSVHWFLAHYGPESISMDTIKSLPEVNEVNKQGCVPLYTLFNNVSQRIKLIWATSSCSEPCLFLSHSLVHGHPDTIKNYMTKHLARYCWQGYSAQIITDRNIPFIWYFHYKTQSSGISSRSHTSLKKSNRCWQGPPTDVRKDSNRCWQVNLEHLRVDCVNAGCHAIFQGSDGVLYLLRDPLFPMIPPWYFKAASAALQNPFLIVFHLLSTSPVKHVQVEVLRQDRSRSLYSFCIFSFLRRLTSYLFLLDFLW